MNKILKGALVAAVVISILGIGAPANPPTMLDEDDMVSDDDTCVATQQSIKAYSDSGTQTMTNKTLTSPVINTSISGTAFLDEDDMVSDSATKIASQQSIKKYVDDNSSTVKEFVILPHLTPPNGSVDDWLVTILGVSNETYFVFHVPVGFSSLIEAVVICIPDATETAQWDNDVSVAAAGEDYNADTRQSLNETKAVTINDMTELDVSATLTGLVAGDYVALRFQSDTNNLQVFGLRIRHD